MTEDGRLDAIARARRGIHGIGGIAPIIGSEAADRSARAASPALELAWPAERRKSVRGIA
jgi:hypothetical protein